MHQIEVEVKTLLGDKKNVDNFISKLFQLDPKANLISQNSQLNHYFIGGNLDKLVEKSQNFLEPEKYHLLVDLSQKSPKYSLRARQIDNDLAILVLKLSIDDTTSSNGTARFEFEGKTNLDLESLDKQILESDFNIEAKWSRKRQEYKFLDTTVCVDENAGYGYLAEIEKVITEVWETEQTKNYLRKLLNQLEAEELSQERIARMFAFYNQNWRDYYGSDKIFTIK